MGLKEVNETLNLMKKRRETFGRNPILINNVFKNTIQDTQLMTPSCTMISNKSYWHIVCKKCVKSPIIIV